ncbi:HIRAN domain-containing protein [uncultured Sphingomonas sp.]|uniref:HIRAN domain-containing protein n=1 Tax=uncultured Sphingomonas sp. TaxID=158754 RepID=UPI0026342F85|nr:HIRAN domain-containing protein [uncultured Sphingomonas sp.]
MDELSLAVVGIDFPNRDGSNRRFEILQCNPGDAVSLRPEPRNLHDRFAVAVLSDRGHQIGYLTAERAPWIGARLRAGEPVVAIFQGLAESAAYIRVAFGGRAPSLPPMTRTEPRLIADDVADPDGPLWGA